MGQAVKFDCTRGEWMCNYPSHMWWLVMICVAESITLITAQTVLDGKLTSTEQQCMLSGSWGHP